MSVLRGLLSITLFLLVFGMIGAWLGQESRLHAQGNAASLVGAWTLNTDLSDKFDRSPREGDQDDRNNGGEGRRRGGFGRGGFGRGGFGGFGGGGGGRAGVDPEEAARMREAMREVMNPPARLTIVSTDKMILLTDGDGHTTRLSTDGKKIKDDSTGIERKTKWDGDKLVSEISRIGPGKITETYSADSEHHQLRVVVHVDNPRRPLTMTRVYDAG